MRQALSKLSSVLLVAGVAIVSAAGSADAAAPTVQSWHVASSKPALVPLLRHDVKIPRKLPRGAHLQQVANATNSVVPAPPAGPTLSTWQVTYTGFDAASNPNGPAAQAAFQAAVNIWSQIVTSPVTIKVNAKFSPLPENVLGSAGPSDLYGQGGVYYASALADAIAGMDVSTSAGGPSEDIDAQFTNLADADFYFGTDGNDPSGDIDFESVVLHELGHGLGFLGDMSVSGSTGGYQVPFAWDEDTYDAATGGNKLLSYSNNSTQLATVLQSQSVYWGGTKGVTNDGGLRPKLFAPATWESGSSYSHLDEATYPIGNANSLMTPSISDNEVVHSPGPITVGILADEGWTAALPSAQAPSAPSAVNAVAGNGQATVSWTAPSNNGSPLTGYTVTASGTGSHTCATTGAVTCIVGGLTNGTSYTFTVTATNAIGTSVASAASSTVTPAGPPSAPTSVGATAGDGSALVSWAAASNGGSAITQYVATASPGGRFCSTTGALSCTVSGLTNGTPYTFAVTATNSVTTSSASASSSAVTPAGVPSAPTGVTASPSDGSATVSWTAPSGNGSPTTGYEVDANGSGPGCTTTTALTCTVSHLTNGTSYTFTVTATNAVGTSLPSAASTAVTPAGPPSAPTSVTATAGDTTALVSWAATSNNGSAITQYVATAFPGSRTCSTAGALSCTVSGLTDGASYTFTVTATNTVTTSAASAASAAVTPAGVPLAPTGVAASAGNGTADVSWTAASNNGSPITGYLVTSSPDGLTCSTTGATGCTVADLANGTSYTFTVTATNAVGASVASTPSASVVPTGPPATVPDAPAAAPTATAGHESATVSWSAPARDGGRPVTGYDVEYSTDGSNWAEASSAFNADAATTQVVADLTDGTAYVFRVAAINSVGTGDYSVASSAVTPSAPPPPANDATQVFSAKSQTIGLGTSVTLATLVADSTTSAPLASSTVMLLAETASQPTFHPVQSLLTSATGTTSVVVKPSVTTHYEFQFAGVTGHDAAIGNIVTISVAPRVSVSASKTHVKPGKLVDLYGAVAPVKAGTVVWLQRKVGSTWKTVAVHAAVKKQKLPNGKKAVGYVLKVPTGARGTASYRVLVKASKTMVAGWSTARKITVT